MNGYDLSILKMLNIETNKQFKSKDQTIYKLNEETIKYYNGLDSHGYDLNVLKDAINKI